MSESKLVDIEIYEFEKVGKHIVASCILQQKVWIC